MGPVQAGGLGWTPDAFWNASVYDLERALAWASRKPVGNRLTADERDEIRRINADMMKDAA